MFGKTKEAPAETGRYRCEMIQPVGKKGSLDEQIQKAMNKGDAKGWHLINATQHSAVVLLYWDTKPIRPEVYGLNPGSEGFDSGAPGRGD